VRPVIVIIRLFHSVNEVVQVEHSAVVDWFVVVHHVEFFKHAALVIGCVFKENN